MQFYNPFTFLIVMYLIAITIDQQKFILNVLNKYCIQQRYPEYLIKVVCTYTVKHHLIRDYTLHNIRSIRVITYCFTFLVAVQLLKTRKYLYNAIGLHGNVFRTYRRENARHHSNYHSRNPELSCMDLTRNVQNTP